MGGAPVKTVRDALSLAVDPRSGGLAIASQSDGLLQLVDP